MRQRALPFLFASLALVTILGCAGPRLPEPTQTPSPPPASPTAAPAEPKPTESGGDTPEPATAEPSGDAQPLPGPAAPLPITFEAGETSATITDQLGGEDVRRYTFTGREAQPVAVSVTAMEPVSLTIIQGDYLRVAKPAAREIRWSGELPTGGPTVVGIRSFVTTSYTLTLRLPATQAPELELVQPDGDEVWLEGTDHTIRWRAPGIDLVDIEAASGGKAWLLATGVEAASEEYVWEIPVGLVSNFGVASSDAMRVRVSNSRDPEMVAQNDRPFTVACPRIAFDPGATAATVNGTLEPAGDQVRYVLEALEDQAVELDVSPGVLEVAVWGAEEGSTWGMDSGSSSLSIAALPATQDYFITLTNPSDDGIDYVLDVTIR